MGVVNGGFLLPSRPRTRTAAHSQSFATRKSVYSACSGAGLGRIVQRQRTSGGMLIRIASVTTVRLQSEMGATIPDQVEFNIAAAAIELPVALAFAVMACHSATWDPAGTGHGCSPTERISAKLSKPSSLKSSEESAANAARPLRCFRKKYRRIAS